VALEKDMVVASLAKAMAFSKVEGEKKIYEHGP